MITVVIIAQNEALHLKELLPLLVWADRRIVVDDNSIDDTANVCQLNQTEIVRHALEDDFAAQRNFALGLVKSGWVLFVDADERLSQELVNRVQEVAKENKDCGYQIQRVDYFLGRQLRFGETKDVWLTRLARVDAGRWQGKVHEVWDIPQTERISGTLRHYSHDSAIQLFKSVEKYARIRAKELFDNQQYLSVWELATYPLGKFIQNYIFRLGCLDGRAGLLMAVAMSWHSFLVRWWLWDMPWLQRSFSIIVLRYLILLPVLLLPFGQLLRGNLGGGGGILVSEVCMGLAIGWGLLSGMRIKKRERLLYLKQMIIFSIILGLSYGMSVWQGGTWRAGLYWLRWLLYVGYFWLWWSNLNELKVSVSGLLRYVGYGLLFGGVLQYLIMPDMRWLHWFGWDDHYFRMIGLLFDPNYFGLMMVLLGWWVYQKEQGKIKWVALIAMIAALLATYSRTSYVITGLLVGWALLQRRRFVMGLIGVMAVGVFLYLLPKPGGEGVNLLRTFSVTARMQSWQTAWQVGWNHPLFGIGFNQYPRLLTPNPLVQEYHPTAPDSTWLYLWATTGLLGVTAFVWMIWGWWKDGSGLVRGSLVAILLHSVMNNSFFYPWVLLWLWLLLLEQKKQKLS